jgi:protein-S-isoprenylcysteine O-methyltransferase Ste14
MTGSGHACPHMLQYKPPRIAMGFLLAAIIVQRALPASWPSLPSSTTGGVIIATLGFTISAGGPGYYVASLSFFLVINSVYCPFEEQKLTRSYPQAFTRYKNDVRRWL